MNYKQITKEFLKQEYIDKKKSIRQISREIKISPSTISNRLKEKKIKIQWIIDGRTNKKYYCKELKCNNEISM